MPSPLSRRLLSLCLALAVLFVVAAPVSAHAMLVRSNPEANVVLARAPVQVELYFSEAVEPSFSTVRVLNANGQTADAGDAAVDPADPTRLFVSLRSLPDGVYTVSWSVLSSVDGHTSSGAFPFAVGNVDAAVLAAAQTPLPNASLPLSNAVARWVMYLSAAMLVGGLLFGLLVWSPAYRALQAVVGNMLVEATPWRRLSLFAAALWLAGNGRSVLAQAGQAIGVELAAPWNPAVATVLFDTRFGALFAARVLIGVALAAVVRQARTARQRWLAFGLALGLLLTISLGSHAAADQHPLVSLLTDWLHLLAASAWVGGLIYFGANLWANRRTQPVALRTQLLARLIPRFSALALLSVSVLTLTGVYTALLRVGSLSALTGTPYGQTLIAKFLIALPMLVLGALNLLLVTPEMRRAASTVIGDPSLTARFRASVTSEAVLGIGLLLSIGLLTSLPPAKTEPPTLTAVAPADDLRLALAITPGRVGLNTFTLTVTANGRPVAGTQAVVLRFTPTLLNTPPSEATLTAEGGGVYSVKGAYFSLIDQWQVQAVVRRASQFDAFGTFTFDLRPTPSNALPWNRVTGGLWLGAALAYVFAFDRLIRSRAWFLGFGMTTSAALLVAGALVFLRPAAPLTPAALINPIAPNAASLAQGQVLFTDNCQRCHGPQGKGDGPDGLALHPPPADLSLHAAPGAHSDGQLFEWISNGFPGSAMPAFKETLSEEQRWHLVNYVRVLATPK